MDLNILVKEEGEDSWNQALEYFFMLMLPWNLAFSSSQFWSGMWGEKTKQQQKKQNKTKKKEKKLWIYL